MPAFLITQRGPEIGRRYELTELQFTIGRGQDNDLVLVDALVSRYHAVPPCVTAKISLSLTWAARTLWSSMRRSPSRVCRIASSTGTS